MDIEAINEEWFLERLEQAEIDVPEMVGVFMAMCEAGRGDEADAWAKMLADALSERDNIDMALPLLQWQAVARGSIADPKAALEKLFGKDRNALKLVEPAGFGRGVPLAECFKRLRHLRALKVGMLCRHPTWGFGVIEHLDHFYQQVEIDFASKGEHELAFAYAAEALETLDDDHILAVKHNKPDELRRLVEQQPAEVVRMALRSYGPMPVTRLQDILTPIIAPAVDWKRFWDAARADLKNDTSVGIPKKRSDNLVLHAKARAYDDEWFAGIAVERDIETLFERFKEVVERKIDYSSSIARAALADRLAFIIKGSPAAKPEWKAEGFVYARTFGIEPAGIDMAALVRDLLDGDLVATFERMPSRQLPALLKILIDADRDSVARTLEAVVPVVSHPVLNEIIATLISNGGEDTVRGFMGQALARRTASAPMLLWCQRSPELLAKWSLIPKGDLAMRIQEVLEVNSSGAMLRAQNQLRERFQQEEWLHDVMDAMGGQQRRDFIRRINEGLGWEVLDRKSLIAKALRRFPDLQDIVVGNKSSAPVRKEIPLTSSRSYAERQRQLERIMTVEIPENSKEIEVARSYGDLRENAEFKFAKERQGLLMAQSTQLAEDLEKVKPTDFAGVPTDRIAMGTGVELQYANGQTETYFILGAWDKDEVLSIISSETRLAKALIGHVAGEQIAIPAGECAIKAVLPLSDAVKAWISG